MIAVKSIDHVIIRIISDSKSKQTPTDLEQLLTRVLGIKKKEIRGILKELIQRGELEYTYHHGHTFLELSHQKPKQISERITLTPDRKTYRQAPGEIRVRLKAGGSFGMGDHPTTRLAIQGLEKGIHFLEQNQSLNQSNILDVGTGSGVLLISALKLGLQRGIGIDIDPCARVEARENLKINGLKNQACISNRPVKSLEGPFDTFNMITANLRYPTLLDMKADLIQKLANGGTLVLSGIKSDELDGLLDHYSNRKLKQIWLDTEKDWSGVLFIRKNN